MKNYTFRFSLFFAAESAEAVDLSALPSDFSNLLYFYRVEVINTLVTLLNYFLQNGTSKTSTKHRKNRKVKFFERLA